MCQKPATHVSRAHFAAYRDERLLSVRSGTVRRELSILHNMFEVAMREWDLRRTDNSVALVRRCLDAPIENADFAQKKRWRSMRRRPVTEIPSSDLSSNWLSRRACAEASCSAFLAPRRPTRPRRVDPRQQERQGAPHRAHPASWHGTGRAGSNYRARVSDVRQRLQAGVGARQAAGGPWRTYTSTTFATRL